MRMPLRSRSALKWTLTALAVVMATAWAMSILLLVRHTSMPNGGMEQWRFSGGAMTYRSLSRGGFSVTGPPAATDCRWDPRWPSAFIPRFTQGAGMIASAQLAISTNNVTTAVVPLWLPLLVAGVPAFLLWRTTAALAPATAGAGTRWRGSLTERPVRNAADDLSLKIDGPIL